MIFTKQELISEIKKAKKCFIRPRFYTSEDWINITKIDALMLASRLSDTEKLEYGFGADPADEHGNLYLG